MIQKRRGGSGAVGDRGAEEDLERVGLGGPHRR
jgi:hypothetical protein